MRRPAPSVTPSSFVVAVIIPCFNEQASIGRVVDDFRTALPDAAIYVYDNNSTDNTVQVALAAGAVVRSERRQGKGSVVRRMFADVDADAYVLVDGDGTYDPSAAAAFVHQLQAGCLDLVNGRRCSQSEGAYRPGHRLGNVLLSRLVMILFGQGLSDMLSGYKVVSRRFAKSFPGLSQGFEIETELAIHALQLGMPLVELPTVYRERGEGSVSKLHTWRDGLRIMRTILRLARSERPLTVFGTLAGMLGVVSLVLAGPVVATFLETGLVPRLPTAVLSAATMLLAFVSLFAGLILDTVTRGRHETKRMLYLAVSAARARDAG